jgi:hypothetical protein
MLRSALPTSTRPGGGVLRRGVRRIAVIYLALVGGTAAVSALFGLLAGGDVRRAIAIGLYLAGIALLVGCFVVGARGPLRGVSRGGETVPLVGARGVRRATSDERSEASRTAILLFFLGLSVVVLAAVLDPAHSAF